MPFSRRGRRIARGRGAGVAAAGIASPRPPRRAPSSSPGRAPPAGSSTAPCGRGGGRSAGACAPRARVWGRARSAAARHASARLRFQLDRRGVGRARARKKGGSRRGRIQFAPTPPVYPRHASPKWAAITGAANATDTGCVAHTTLGARPFATRRAPSIARSRLVDFLRSIPSARRESTRCLERSIDARSRLSPPFRSQPPLPSSRTLFTASYTRRRMAATTAAAAAAGSALPP